jgi:hypothetical protein
MDVRVCPAIPKSPEITVLLSGLMLQRFNFDTNVCSIAALKDEPSHLFSIIVRGKIGDQPAWTLYRGFENVGETLSIDVHNPISNQICQYRVGELDRKHPTCKQEKDFRWAIDLEGAGLHSDRRLDIIPEQIRPAITINNGVFYTALRTQPASIRVFRTKGITHNDYSLYSIASITGVAIRLNADGYVNLSFNSKAPFLVLPNLSARGISYEIRIENDPVNVQFLSPEHHAGHPAGSRRIISHFKKYYRAIRNVKDKEKFDIEYEPAPMPEEPLTERDLGSIDSTPDVPCMIGWLGGL